MKTTLLLLFTAISVAFATPTASATPGEDQALLYILRLRHMYIGEEGINNALDLAYRVCQDRDIGVDVHTIKSNLYELVPQWKQADVEFFYGAATMIYCPGTVT